MLTPVSLASRALVKIGDNPITSFEDNTPGSIAAAQEYEEIVKASLGRRLWTFSQIEVEMQRLADQPLDTTYSTAWQLPRPSIVKLHTCRKNGCPVPYRRVNDQVYANVDDGLIAHYTFRCTEEAMDPSFREALVLELAAHFSVSVAGDTDLGTYFEQKAQQKWMAAAFLDSQTQTVRKAGGASRLVAVRN